MPSVLGVVGKGVPSSPGKKKLKKKKIMKLWRFTELLQTRKGINSAILLVLCPDRFSKTQKKSGLGTKLQFYIEKRVFVTGFDKTRLSHTSIFMI